MGKPLPLRSLGSVSFLVGIGREPTISNGNRLQVVKRSVSWKPRAAFFTKLDSSLR